METPKHHILSQLEVSALLVEWGTMWSGLMIFQLDDSKPSDKGFGVVLTVVVILTNAILLICFVVHFIRAKLNERTERARLAVEADSNNPDPTGGNIEMVGCDNPLLERGVENAINKKKREVRMKKVRNKLSIGAKVKRSSGQNIVVEKYVAPEAEAEAEAEVEPKKDKWIELQDEEGRTYYYNELMEETAWHLPGEEEAAEEHDLKVLIGGEEKIAMGDGEDQGEKEEECLKQLSVVTVA